MGFFSDLKEDLSQAVNELLPEEEQATDTLLEEAAADDSFDAETNSEETVAVPNDAKSLEEMLEKMDTEELFSGILEESEDGFLDDDEALPEIGESSYFAKSLGDEVDAVEIEKLLADLPEDDVLGLEEPLAEAMTEEMSVEPTVEEAIAEEIVSEDLVAEAIVEETVLEDLVTEAIAEEAIEEKVTEESSMSGFFAAMPEENADEELSTEEIEEIVSEIDSLEEAIEVVQEINEEEEKAEMNMDFLPEEGLMTEAVLENNENTSTEELGGFHMDSQLTNKTVADETAVITAGMTINGDMVSEGSVEVIGTVIGNIDILGKLNITGSIQGNSKAAEVYAENAKITGEISSEGSVKIGQSSVIIGNISATSAVIAGAVKGDIDVHGPVILDTSAIVMGNIKSKSVQINNGAVIEGMCSQCYADVNPTSFFEDFKKSKNNK